jgi:glucosamine--fructose-6-phosphate aminotransferase (isomerizing)
MCGIVGIVGKAPVASRLVEGLRRLEYRGYDSAGIATLVGGQIERRRAAGKLSSLADLLAREPLAGHIGIGHTRWATHGKPTESNAHPHAAPEVAVVHNGIIENFRELRAELAAAGHVFASETDTETIAHLVADFLKKGLSPRDAVAATLKRLKGAFALAFLFRGRDDLLIGARRGSPLAVGYGDGEMYLGSDALALAPFANRISYLEEGDWVELSHDGAVFHDQTDAVVKRPAKALSPSAGLVDKGNHRHFMLKEIHEQPQTISYTLASYIDPLALMPTIPDLGVDLGAVDRITIVACGTACLAGLVAKSWLEQLARVPVEVDIGSEFRYREPPMPKRGLALFVSQSGETADTLAALRYARSQGQHIVSIVNVPESTIARESDAVLATHAGPEIGVASTKAFTAQLVVLASFALAVAKARHALPDAQIQQMVKALIELPACVAEVLRGDEAIASVCAGLSKARDVLYIGRGSTYPLALEGALKLKEISYIHAEGYAAGELKHGPIALIDEQVPVICIAPPGPVFEKIVSNMQEAVARGGQVILLSDAAGVDAEKEIAAETVTLPAVDPFVAPILYAIPVQLIAYHTAVLKGTDVDQPRNLAKSVTVE